MKVNGVTVENPSDRRIKFSVFMNEEQENFPIIDTELSQRSKNSLCRAGIKTFGDLVEKFDTIEHIRNLGVKSVMEIRAYVFAMNLANIWDKDDLLHKFAESLDGYVRPAATRKDEL